jgi:hypothetical protein
MAQLLMNGAQGVTFVVEYTPQNGKCTGLTCTNTNAYPVLGRATLSDGRVVSQTYGPNSTTTTPLPSNVVSVTFDAAGDAVFTGLQSTELFTPAP